MLLASCYAALDEAGRRPPAAPVPVWASQWRDITPGKTTKDEVLQSLGRPQFDHTFPVTTFAGRKIDQPVEVMLYSQANGVARRRVSIYLIDSVVVRYTYGSTFKADSTDFDLEKASTILKKVTREQDIIAAFGSPTGRGIYPFAKSPTGTSMSYGFFVGPKTKRLVITFDADRVVEDFEVMPEQ
jgi:outer membrane protein assembly factor BamE (lipoprotein component of BamABCDE complex)